MVLFGTNCTNQALPALLAMGRKSTEKIERPLQRAHDGAPRGGCETALLEGAHPLMGRRKHSTHAEGLMVLQCETRFAFSVVGPVLLH